MERVWMKKNYYLARQRKMNKWGWWGTRLWYLFTHIITGNTQLFQLCFLEGAHTQEKKNPDLVAPNQDGKMIVLLVLWCFAGCLLSWRSKETKANHPCNFNMFLWMALLLLFLLLVLHVCVPCHFPLLFWIVDVIL